MKFRVTVAKYFKDLGIPVKADGYKWILSDAGSKTAADRIVASYDPTQRKVYLNQRHPFWVNPDRAMAVAFSQRLLSTADPMHPAYQELGHALHHAAVGDIRYQSLGARELDPTEKAMAKSEVSKYAAVSPLEFVAEVFAGRKVGKVYNQVVMALYVSFGGPEP
jgi:hypothetical protein